MADQFLSFSILFRLLLVAIICATGEVTVKLNRGNLPKRNLNTKMLEAAKSIK